MGAPDADPVCANALADTDCLVAPSAVTPSDGIGPLLTINANLIMGNSAESGSGGGIAFQNVNGTDVVSFPTHSFTVESRGSHQQHHHQQRSRMGWRWNFPSGCVEHRHHQQHHRVERYDRFVGRTVQHPRCSVGQQPRDPTCTANPADTTSTPQPAGLVSIQNSAVLVANLPGDDYLPGRTLCRNHCQPTGPAGSPRTRCSITTCSGRTARSTSEWAHSVAEL